VLWLLLVVMIALGVVLFGLHRLALWAERRGWLYYRDRKPPAGAASMAMMELDTLWKPNIEHVVDEMWSGDSREATDERSEDD